jgi:NADH-quinone oxidoreductase subunit B
MRVAVEPILLACCAVEVATALHSPACFADIEWVTTQPELTVVVIAGTITTTTESSVAARIAAIDGPKTVIAYGVCASTGGPYWDSHAVVQGWPEADLFVPGCPPPARVLWNAVARAAREAAAHAAG